MIIIIKNTSSSTKWASLEILVLEVNNSLKVFMGKNCELDIKEDVLCLGE